MSTKHLGLLGDFPPDEMRQMEVDGQKYLVVRRGGQLTAIEATCPHAGGPLAEGVLDGDRVICPWHKAAFCISDGKRLEPPAVDDLRNFPVEIRGDDVLLMLDEASPPEPPVQSDARCFVIIGRGAAGYSAAQELRAEGFAGRVVLVDREGGLPYDRTILSKYILSGQKGGEKSPLQDAAFFASRNIELRTADVTALDPACRTITFANGETVPYDAALIATGGALKDLPFAGAERGGVFQLRSQADAARIVEAAQAGKRAVIIGASFIGMEVAGSLRERGLEVTLIGEETAPFEKQLGAQVGNVFRRLHESKGVEFRLDCKIESLHYTSRLEAVILQGGERVDCDFVVAGLGVQPATDFVAALTREDRALVVGGDLRVVPSLYAAGDVAAFPLRGDGKLVRVEHWRVAEQQGRVAARAMMGLPAVYDAVPFFWTIHYMKRLDYAGHASGTDEIVIRGDLQKPAFIAYYLRDGTVAAAAGFDSDQDMAAVLALMSSQRDWTVDQIHPPGASPSAVLAGRRSLQPGTGSQSGTAGIR